MSRSLMSVFAGIVAAVSLACAASDVEARHCQCYGRSAGCQQAYAGGCQQDGSYGNQQAGCCGRQVRNCGYRQNRCGGRRQYGCDGGGYAGACSTSSACAAQTTNCNASVVQPTCCAAPAAYAPSPNGYAAPESPPAEAPAPAPGI